MAGGGAERQLAYLAGGLRDAGWNVHVSLIDGGANMERLERSGATIHRLRVRSYYDPALVLEAARVIGKVGPDLVQTWLPQMDIVAGTAATVRGVPWIVSERAADASALTRIKHGLRRVVTLGARAIAANSKQGAAYWESLRPGAPRTIIPNALPLDEIEATAAADLAAYRTTPETKLLIAVGRMDDGKNYVALLDAVEIALQTHDVAAVICGNGPNEKQLHELVASRGLGERVFLPGFISDVWGWMKGADLYISASHSEGQPNTVMEAAACRLPLLLSDIPSHRDLFDESGAAYFDRHDPRAIAAAIRSLIDGPIEADARVSVAAEIAKSWTIQATAKRYAALYAQVLDHA